MRKFIITGVVLIFSITVYAGGNPEHIKIPENYRAEFTQYDTRNRTNGKQLAVLYANQTAIDSAEKGILANGSKVVMEVYKTKTGEDSQPIADLNGLFEKGKFAAIAVMEKNTEWRKVIADNDLTEDWGYAIYKADGSIKENDLDCAACHTPLRQQDYMFSHASLMEYIKNLK